MSPKVALKRYDSSPESLRQVIALCSGFRNLKSNSKILIKPNLVVWDNKFPIPPYGVFTTTRIIEDLIILLKEQGCSDITIGEGGLTMKGEATTFPAFEGLGYTALAEKYGVRLVDFHKSQTAIAKNGEGQQIRFARDAIETDFFINVPVIKTHSQTKVSLGMKNMKGCLKTVSRKQFHDTRYGLENWIQWLPDILNPALTIIDGIYALEMGALHVGSTAHRKNILIASTDALGADLVGAKAIGFNGDEIDHLKKYATRTGKPLQLEAYEIKGDSLADNITPFKWDWRWNEANTGPYAFEKAGIQGISVPKYDSSLCSGCSPLVNMINVLVMSAYKGAPFEKIEVLNGKKMQAQPGFDKTLLIGNCIIAANRANPNIKKALKVAGCPPSEEALLNGLKSAGIEIDPDAYSRFLIRQSEKYLGKPDFVKTFFECSTSCST
ncbi:MAG: DUF362 domain-containing protein [Dehalococcoidales bacterium]|nr:DUF362 domain-containing protein [Dehalococcoidales bacterium]